MAGFKNRGKNILLVIFLFVISTVVLVQALRRAATRLTSNFFHPFISAPSNIESTLLKKSLLLENKTSLVAMIEKLQEENDKFSARFASRRKLKDENLQLRELLRLKPYSNYKCLFAELILRDPAFWEERFTLNKGSVDGVRKGAIVLAADSSNKSERLAVIGRIKSVQKYNCVVSTLASKDCNLSVVLPQSKAAGITNGGNRSRGNLSINVTYLPRDMKYRAGEPIYTSGLSPSTPPALLVGTLAFNNDNTARVRIHDNLYLDGEIKPSADIEKVKFVMIMIKLEEELDLSNND